VNTTVAAAFTSITEPTAAEAIDSSYMGHQVANMPHYFLELSGWLYTVSAKKITD